MTNNNECDAFEATFDKIVVAISVEQDEELTEPRDWLTKVIQYNVPHGKRYRAKSVLNTVRLINEHERRNVCEEEMELARVLAWSMEFLQAYGMLVDDMADQAIIRRGEPCWYRKDGVGLISLNDAILLDETVHHILKIFFSDKPYYKNLLNVMHEICLYTSYGQCMDTLFSKSVNGPKLEEFTPMRYATITKYKTGYYSFVLPVRLAMYMCSLNSAEEHKSAEETLLRIGHLFQMQDDYLDCWGDPAITGKIGTDIEDGKCSWPVVAALQLANDTQIDKLRANFAKRDGNCVRRVKDVFNELKLIDVFRKEEEQMYKEICQLIDGLKDKNELNYKICTALLKTVYKREK